MSAEPDFDRTYRLLGVGPEQGWDAVRRAYRQRVQALHPDKVGGDAHLVQQARQRFEQLNNGYRELRRYRRIFGALPPAGLAAPATADKPRHPRPDRPRPPRRSRRPLALIALGLAGAAGGWFVYERTPSLSARPVADHLETPPAPIARPARIAVGASLVEVLDIQGQPDRTDEDTWYYGDSWIGFDKGRVVSWQAFSGQPLNTVTLSPTPGATLPEATPSRDLRPGVRFSLGATKAEVKQIQGEPLRTSEAEWDYGVSKVYFENDRVVGWFNSPLDPLRVRETHP